MNRSALLTVFLAALPALAQIGGGQAVSFRNAPDMSRAPAAPGAVVAAFGTFTGVNQTAPSGLPQTSLGGVQLRVGGTLAPLYFVSSTQINFQVPYSAPVGQAVRVSILQNGNAIAGGELAIASSAPRIFVLEPANPNQPGAIVNLDGSVNGVNRPAAPGSIVSVFASGHGAALTQPVGDGQRPDGLVRTTATPTALIGLRRAEVLFSGPSPETSGLWQLNLKLPDGLPP